MRYQDHDRQTCPLKNNPASLNNPAQERIGPTDPREANVLQGVPGR